MRGTILMACVAALVGCEESTMVGSGCPNGACPEALVRDDDECTVRTDVAELATSDPLSSPAVVCIAQRLERAEDGLVNARMYFVIGPDALPQIECTDRAFLKPVATHLRDEIVAGYPGATVCEVVQLPIVTSGDGGALVMAAGDGFYYDDFSDSAAMECGQESPQRIAMTAGAQPWEGITVTINIAELRDADGNVDSSLSCEPVQGTEPIGTACSLAMTEYHDSQALISTRSADCGQGVCLAYHLHGRVDGECADGTEPGASVGDAGVRNDPECADPDQIAERMYCTCRCDGPPGTMDLCDCPDGFSCVDVVSALVPEAQGGYCVRNGRIVD